MKRLFIPALLTVLLLSAALLFPFEVRTEHAFICKTTGSRYGYQQWRVIGQTGRWYEASPLEAFMKKQHPQLLHHHWVSYVGTGKNLLGKSISWGHGRPGPILNMTTRIPGGTILEAYCAKVSDYDKLRLYQTLEGDDEPAARFALDTAFAIATGMPLPATNTFAAPKGLE